MFHVYCINWLVGCILSTQVLLLIIDLEKKAFYREAAILAKGNFIREP